MGLLRFLLALTVVICHIQQNSASGSRITLLRGDQAVCLFFIISGFYMGLILNEKYRPDWNGITAFFQNRLLRLWPTYLVVLPASIAWYFTCVWFTHGRTPHALIFDLGSRGNWTATAGLWFANISMMGLDLPSLFHFSKDGHYLFMHESLERISADGARWVGDARWIGPAWSVGAEIWFYLIAPFLVCKAIWKIALIALLSWSLHYTLGHVWHYSPYMVWPAQFWLFLLGVLTYRLTAHVRMSPGVARFSGLAAIIAVVYLVIIGPMLNLGVSHWTLYLLMVVLIPLLFRFSNTSSFDRRVGDLSYPIYIVHMLVLNIAIISRKRIPMGDLLFMTLVIAATVIAALLLIRFVEAPMEHWRSIVANKGAIKLPQSAAIKRKRQLQNIQ